MNETVRGPRAKVTVSHSRPYDYDEKRGIWLYNKVDDDEDVWNLVTNAGRVQLHTFCYGTNSRPNGFRYVGISADGTAPAASDVALTGELAGNGLSRAAGTVTLPVGAGTVTTVQKVFTFTAAGPQIVQKSALFDTGAAGVMAHEVVFTARTLFLNDTLTLTYAITLT